MDALIAELQRTVRKHPQIVSVDTEPPSGNPIQNVSTPIEPSPMAQNIEIPLPESTSMDQDFEIPIVEQEVYLQKGLKLLEAPLKPPS
ncbi:unnamed protein product [Lactuca saligna]|uniref:Uncharacterized protein n=1 Tax=Lactuca saligna TaxID=75948 RepID=A0AA36A438_LACSI|nr:unnamed protein product [Lactuca saligna]